MKNIKQLADIQRGQDHVAGRFQPNGRDDRKIPINRPFARFVQIKR